MDPDTLEKLTKVAAGAIVALVAVLATLLIFRKEIARFILASTRITIFGLVIEKDKLRQFPEERQRPEAPPKAEALGLAELNERERNKHYMLAHVYWPSNVRGQKFEIFIFIAKHVAGSEGPPQTERFDEEIEKAEFFFGKFWGNEVFPVKVTKGMIGIRTHAYGTFVASCRITFKDQTKIPIILDRYIDFFRAPGLPLRT